METIEIIKYTVAALMFLSLFSKRGFRIMFFSIAAFASFSVVVCCIANMLFFKVAAFIQFLCSFTILLGIGYAIISAF